MYRQEKSHLTYQIEGRLSAYLSEIDNCKDFKSNSQTKLDKTMKMTECIHSLLQHLRTNCLNDNKLLLDKHNLTINKDAELSEQFSLTWTSTKTSKTISGFLKIDFFIPDIKLLNKSNFKSDNIHSLSNLLIDLTTLTFANGQKFINKSIAIIKTKDVNVVTKENADDLKNDLEKYCSYDKDNPTFLFLKHKDVNGHFHKHYSNFDTDERTTTR
ncbi:MAG TPA: hypothetical protein DCM02_08290 [Flavobacterium sp.]|nr:hypothetical protein [Flavobacterium sp.]HAT75412.1 hypothetical protein [Flavobacterium sp.]